MVFYAVLPTQIPTWKERFQTCMAARGFSTLFFFSGNVSDARPSYYTRVVFALSSSRPINTAGIAGLLTNALNVRYIAIVRVEGIALLAVMLAHVGFHRSPKQLFGPDNGDEINLGVPGLQPEYSLSLARLSTDFMAIPAFERKIRCDLVTDDTLAASLKKRGFEIEGEIQAQGQPAVSALIVCRNDNIRVEVEKLLRAWVDPKAEIFARFDEQCQNVLLHAMMKVSPTAQWTGIYGITGLLEMLTTMMPKNSSVMSIVPVDLAVRRNPLSQAILALLFPEASDTRDDYWRKHLVLQVSLRPPAVTIDDLVSELGRIVAPGTKEARSQLDELILDVPSGFYISLPDSFLRVNHDSLSPGDFTRSTLSFERLASFLAAAQYGAGFLTTASFAFRDTINGNFSYLKLTDALDNSAAVFTSLLGSIACFETEETVLAKRPREQSPKVAKRSKTIPEKLSDDNALKQAYARMQHAHDVLTQVVPPSDASTAYWLSTDWKSLIQQTRDIRDSLQEACDILIDIDWCTEQYPECKSPNHVPATAQGPFFPPHMLAERLEL